MNETVRDKTESASGAHHKEYVIPPGLVSSVVSFGAHYKAAQGDPVLIEGPTGVGKTMFIDIFKILYREEHGVRPPIVTINCSHYGGDLARSELFGHIKGAFSGALKDKKGLIETAHGGLLILEEIGDLPPETQAQLLTFIETGMYYRVGGVKLEKSQVQLLGATNRPKKLRDDFLYRFFRFSIPPLYQRRGDVLYYIDTKFPGLMLNANVEEVLNLLTYNWPGNVREVDTFAKQLYASTYELLALDFLHEPSRHLSHDSITTLITDVGYYTPNRENEEPIAIMGYYPTRTSTDSIMTRLNNSHIMVKEYQTRKGHNRFSHSHSDTFRYVTMTIEIFINRLLNICLVGTNHTEHLSDLIKDDIIRNRLKTMHIRYTDVINDIFRWPFTDTNIQNDVARSDMVADESAYTIRSCRVVSLTEGIGNTHTQLIRFKFIRSEILEMATLGLYLYCMLFFQKSDDDKNLRDVSTGYPVSTNMSRLIRSFLIDNLWCYDDHTDESKNYIPNRNRRYDGHTLLLDRGQIIEKDKHTSTIGYVVDHLEETILRALTGIDIADGSIPLYDYERDKAFLRISRKYPHNKFLRSLVPEYMYDSMIEDDEEADNLQFPLIPYKELIDHVERSYHERLLKRTNGNAAAAARIAQVPYQSFKTRLRRLKITFDANE